MRILITNLYLSEYRGSEVNCYELSRYFRSRNHEVEVLCFEKHERLTSYFEKFNIVVCTNVDELTYQEYDLIWAQHYVVLNIVLLSNIRAQKIILSSLSPFESFEFPPIYANKLSICLANSFETRQQLESNGVNFNNIFVFPNSVDFIYFNKNKQNHKLARIACVSNHPPSEIADAEFRYLLAEKGIQIDYLGKSKDIYTLVDQDLLLSYDCIITIGKTVQYAMASKIPVYCYDHFGGPGWINKTNIDAAFENNFSGRGFNHKTANQIVDEIVSGYIENLENLSYLYQFCYLTCNLQKNINYVLSVTKRVKDIEIKEMQVDSFLFRRVFNMARGVTNKLNKSAYCQLFVDFGCGFSEANSIKSINSNSRYMFFGELVVNNLKNLRFDPSNKKCIISNFSAWLIDDARKIFECAVVGHNATLVKDGKYYFDTNDSMFYLSVPIENPIFFKYSFEIEDLKNSAYFNAYQLLI